VREILAIERFMGARKYEQGPIPVEQRTDSFLRMAQQTLSAEEVAKLLGPGIARDRVSQFL
jgi:hypothetical protein